MIDKPIEFKRQSKGGIFKSNTEWGRMGLGLAKKFFPLSRQLPRLYKSTRLNVGEKKMFGVNDNRVSPNQADRTPRTFGSKVNSPTNERSQRTPFRGRILNRLFWIALGVLFLKVMHDVLNEYRWYFPPDFNDSSFLIGRNETFFQGFFELYPIGFFLHIICGPISLLLGLFLWYGGTFGAFRKWHRFAGRIQLGIVLLGVVPGGLIMSTQAYTGPIAGWSFAFHALATAATAWMAYLSIRRRDLEAHRRWAYRCLVLLFSPLLLRILLGAVNTLEVDSPVTYRLFAWASWTMPWAAFEVAKAKRWQTSFTGSSYIQPESQRI